jgi:hypothetical protein
MIDRDRPDTPITLSRWLLIAIVTGASCYAGYLYLRIGGRPISPIWPAAGVSMAFFVKFGLKAAPPIVLGHLLQLAWLPLDTKHWPLLLAAFVYPFEAWLVSVVGHRKRSITAAYQAALWPIAWRHLGAPIVCSLPCSLVITLAFAKSGKFATDEIGYSWFLILLSHVHGMIAFGSVSVHVLQRDFSLTDLKKSMNGVLAGLSAVVVMTLAFTGVFEGVLSPSSALLLPFPLLVMAAAWLSPAPASLLVAVWCALSTILACLGPGQLMHGYSENIWVSPAELGLYNMVMASVAYLVSIASSHLQRQLNLNEVALAAAGIELWEWEAGVGFSCIQGSPSTGLMRHATNGGKGVDALSRLAGGELERNLGQDSWRSRIKCPDLENHDPTGSVTLESVGRILQRDIDDRPTKAMGLLQDLSQFQKTEEALIALGYQKAKLRSLQAKLTPHFLFNSLNVIHALVHIDPKRADEAITSLAHLLRCNFRTTETTLVRLGEELDHVRALLHLARLRFGERIMTRIDVPSDLLEAQVPPMLILNLVENAITHGIGNLEMGGWVTIAANTTSSHLCISIQNTGTLPANAVRGLGTQDASQRLELIFNGRAKFSLRQKDEANVSADLDLPLEFTFLS